MHENTSIATKPQSGPTAVAKEVAATHHAVDFDPESELNDKFPIQLKLSVGAANDPLEHEADAMADKVMRMPETSFVQRKASSSSSGDYDDGHVRLKPLASQITPFIQAKGDGSGVVSDAVSSKIKSSMGGGSTMDTGTRSFMENRFGTDFGDVKIHNNAESEHLNRSLDAKAFTVSNNIYFNGGQYAPGTDIGKHLLAHELTHVVQQSPLDLTRTANNPDVQRKSDDTIQLKGRTPGGFFSNMGRSFLSLFGDEPGFSDETLQKYLGVIDTGEIEDDDDSDDKARAVVKWWMSGKLILTPQRKLMLIKEMFSGIVSDGDKNAILDLLGKKSPDEDVAFILSMIPTKYLRDNIDGKQAPRLEAILIDIANRKVQIGPAPVNVVKEGRMKSLDILGDGTAANKGITVGDFQAYISKQADWFIEPSLSDANRETLWNIAFILQKGDHIASALGQVLLSVLATALNTPKMVPILAYAEGAKTTAKTVRISAPSDKIDRIIELGTAMAELNSFVPGIVLRVCINQASLEEMVDSKLIAELKKYYLSFSPTVENPKETKYLLELLKETIAAYITLTNWVHDLHTITKNTRTQLVKNITDKTRARPVLLVLMSGLDWNGAFLQAANLEAAITNNANLALLIQGAGSLKGEIAQLDKVADDYGQIPKGEIKGRLGQVVIAGHGQDTSVEQITTGAGAKSADDKTVSYNQTDIQFGQPGHNSEALIDEALKRMDPKDARIVFAGCLVGSHDVAEADITNTKSAAADINKSIQAHPNLRDMVNARMAALKVQGRVEAANASTQFRSFTLDAKGKAKLAYPQDPDIGGTKDEYVKTGIEPEGALRAALETWADKKFGPAWTTAEMKKHVARTAANKGWYESLTRTAFELALPKAGDVDPQVINDLAHRVASWLFMGWAEMASVASLNRDVKATEAPILYPVMLTSNFKGEPHLQVGVQEAWMQLDVKHEADFMNALETTPLKRIKLTPLIDDTLVGPHLLKLLTTINPAKPTKGQLLLSLTIAVTNGAAMPAAVKTLLINAAGGGKTSKFPAILNVQALLDGTGELGILKDIGLAPGSAPTPMAPQLEDANLDTDNDKMNDTFVSVDARRVTLSHSFIARSLPSLSQASTELATLSKGDDINIIGMTNNWTVIDLKDKVGYILYKF